MRFQLSKCLTSLTATALAFAAISAPMAHAHKKDMFFSRVATFEVCEQIDPSCNTDTETVAETLWYFKDGDKTCLVYTDAEEEQLGFVDISDPSAPVAGGVVDLAGEPTTVRVIGNYAVVGVNTSPDFINPTGQLTVIDLSTREVAADLPLPGQPDAVDVSKTSGYPKYITIAIENERDESLDEGYPPQLPAGTLTIFTIADEVSMADPSLWLETTVDLTGYDACEFPSDPEPEYVSISGDNKFVVVTMQENNCNAIVDLEKGEVVNMYDAGSVMLTNIDLTEEDVINQSESATFKREADGATFLGDTMLFATANEGDLEGGSRGFTIFDAETGAVVYDSGNTMDLEVARIGHYPDNRSGNKGNEPENVFYTELDGYMMLVVLSERSNCAFVYEVSDPAAPELMQIIPTGVGPEGVTVVVDMGVLAIASEVDERDEGARSAITLYQFGKNEDGPDYPTLESKMRESGGSYIPFSALSGLAASGTDDKMLFAVEDKEFRMTRVLCIDTSVSPACIVQEDFIMDINGVLEAALSEDDDEIVNDDGTVNLDLQGIAVAPGGGFWVVSKKHKALIKLSADHVVEEVIPLGVKDMMGVEVDGDKVIVLQGEADEEGGNPMIVVYDTVTSTMKSVQVVLEAPLSQNGGKVCLTDIASMTSGVFYLIQADDQFSKDAAIKQISKIDLGDYSFEDQSTIGSELYRDLIPDLSSTGGQIPADVSGLAIDVKGEVFVVNDNGGVGETFFMNVSKIKTKKAKAKKAKAPKKGKR